MTSTTEQNDDEEMSILKIRGAWAVDFPFQVPGESLCFPPVTLHWNIDREKAVGEELSHPALLPQKLVLPGVFQISTEKWHYLQDILPQDIKVMELGSPDQTLSSPSSAYFWIVRTSEQADADFVWAGQAGIHARKKRSPVSLLFIASSWAVSLLPVPELPAVTDVSP